MKKSGPIPSTPLMLALLCAGLCTSSITRAEDPPTDYGTLYLIEQRKPLTSAWTLGAALSYEFSNPYLNVLGAGASVQRRFSHFLSAGIELTGYFRSETALTESIKRTLRNAEIDQQIHSPDFSAYATVTVVPFAGHVNLFAGSTIPFDIAVTAGPGVVHYPTLKGRPYFGSAQWALKPRFALSSSFQLEVGLRQEIESPFTEKALVHTQGLTGINLRL